MLKANDLASVIEARVDSRWLDAMGLQKLLYYMQAWHLAIKGQPLFEGQFEAWPEGPVLPEVLHARRHKVTRREMHRQAAQIELDGEVSDLLELVVRNYGSLTSDELTALTKIESPWRDARGDLPDGAPSTNVISNATTGAFFALHRKLQGHDAMALSVAGVHVRPYRSPQILDAGVAIEPLEDDFGYPREDRWPSANLDFYASYTAKKKTRRMAVRPSPESDCCIPMVRRLGMRSSSIATSIWMWHASLASPSHGNDSVMLWRR